MLHTCENPWKDIANAIIQQAAEDYREALNALKANPGDKSAKGDIVEIEGFFESGWFGRLTKVSGEWLKEALRREVLGA